MRATLSGVLAWKNENRSCDLVGTPVRTANIVTSTTRLTMSVLTSRMKDPALSSPTPTAIGTLRDALFVSQSEKRGRPPR
jgi:hypothetical protein